MRSNAYAERWVPRIQAEATDRMLITGPRYLHAILGRYFVHYNQPRPRRVLNLRPPSSAESAPAPLPISRRRRYDAAASSAG